MFRKAGNRLSDLFVALGVSPNQLTVGRFVFFSPFVAVLYAGQGYWLPVAGLACLYANVLLDFTDGAIARKTGKVSAVGGWLDGRHDFLMQCVLLSGALVHVIRSDVHLAWSVVGVAAMFSQAALVQHTSIVKGLLDRRLDLFRQIDTELTLRTWDRVVIDIALTRSNTSALLFTFRYWVTFLTLVGQVPYMLLAIALTQTVRWLVLHGIMARLLSAEEGSLTPVWAKMKEYVFEEYSCS